MRRLLCAALCVAGLAGVMTPVVAEAFAIAMPARPAANRVATNDAIIVGRVMGMEDVDVKVPIAKGSDQKVAYRIAVVSVADVVKGKKDLKQIRVGFMVQGGGPVDGGGLAVQPRPAIGRPGFGNIQLQPGQEGLFYLTKHAEADFFITTTQFDFVPSQSKAQFDKEIAEAKHACKLLDNPMESLKAKDQKDRYLTAALLISQYRTPRGGNKTEKVSVEESKLILTVLAEADWKQAMGNPGVGTGGIKRPVQVDPIAPMQIFNMLGVSQKDGFTPPTKIKTQDEFANACRDWCRQAAGTYQIQRFVEEAAK